MTFWDTRNERFAVLDLFLLTFCKGSKPEGNLCQATLHKEPLKKEKWKKTSKKFGRYEIKSLSLHPLSERKAFVKKKRSMKRLHKQYVVQERRNEDWKDLISPGKEEPSMLFPYIYKEREELRTSVNQSVVLNRANVDRKLSQKIFLQWRVWSWLRMNASYRPNTCKSRGSMIEACFNWWRPAHGWVTRIQPSADSGIAFRKKD